VWLWWESPQSRLPCFAPDFCAFEIFFSRVEQNFSVHVEAMDKVIEASQKHPKGSITYTYGTAGFRMEYVSSISAVSFTMIPVIS
jgi:hypothetical protein